MSARCRHTSTPGQIADVVYEAATDSKGQLPYLAGADTQASYATRPQLGNEALRRATALEFLGDPDEKM